MPLHARLFAVPLVAAAAAAAAATAPAPAPDRTDADLAQLRAEGPPALERLLTAYDRARPGPARDALAATIDKVAAQRYATVSRLYWYTDLDAAKKAAHASGRPILSLRMLGRLDEDLSCANSRFFRTILYANADVSRFLRDHFVLHWSSERPVPTMTIDFGDGRRLERTVTGNSIHYVLDADGRPLDALPGLYAPAIFRAELERSLELVRRVADADDIGRGILVEVWHSNHRAERAFARSALGSVTVLTGARRLTTQADLDGALAKAQSVAITKAYVEVPTLLRTVDLGADPGSLAKLDGDVEVWAAAGQRAFGGRIAPGTLLDASSRALVGAVLGPRDRAEVDAILARLEQTVVADTAQNELRLRPEIDALFLAGAGADLAGLNRRIYAEIFHTPATDPWLGLLDRTSFSGLPGDGVVRGRE